MVWNAPVRKKFIVLTGLAFVNFFSCLIAAEYIHPAFVLPTFGIPILCAVAALALRCPQCGRIVPLHTAIL
jgi:hypothetical protein